MTMLHDIDSFLAERRIALVGASRDKKDFSRVVMREMLARGYDVVPVNRGVSGPLEIEGRAAYASLGAIPGKVGGAIIMVPPEQSAAIVADAVAAGIERVWLHRGAGRGASSPAAVALAKAHGLQLIDGECPMMVMPDAGLVHRVHYAIRELGGSAPRRVPEGPNVGPSGGPFGPRVGRGLHLALGFVQALLALGMIAVGALTDDVGALFGLVAGTAHLAAAGLLTLRGRERAGVGAIGLGVLLGVAVVIRSAWLPGPSLVLPLFAVLAVVEVGLGMQWLGVFAPRVRPIGPARR